MSDELKELQDKLLEIDSLAEKQVNVRLRQGKCKI